MEGLETLKAVQKAHKRYIYDPAELPLLFSEEYHKGIKFISSQAKHEYERLGEEIKLLEFV